MQPYIGEVTKVKKSIFGIPVVHKVDPKSTGEVLEKFRTEAEKIVNNAAAKLEKVVEKANVRVSVDEKSVSSLEDLSKRSLKRIETMSDRLRKIDSKRLILPSVVIGAGLAIGKGIGSYLDRKKNETLSNKSQRAVGPDFWQGMSQQASNLQSS